MKTLKPGSAYLGWLSRVLGAAAPDGGRHAVGDLVLGYAAGYDAASIAPFVRSLRAVFGGSAAMVVNERPDVLALLDEHGVEAVVVEPGRAWEPHAVVARFAAWARLLDARPGVGDVLLTDVRDVVFQGDPFCPRPPGLEVFVENEEGRLGDHAFNMKHLAALVGADLSALLADKPCICVGTIVGPREEVARLCRLILMLAAIPRSGAGGAFGADQAACNLAVHLGLASARVRANYGRVATVGLTGRGRVRFADGLILNPDGSASPIVHQYDRHPEIARRIHKLWAGDRELRAREARRTSVERIRRLAWSVTRRIPELR